MGGIMYLKPGTVGMFPLGERPGSRSENCQSEGAPCP